MIESFCEKAKRLSSKHSKMMVFFFIDFRKSNIERNIYIEITPEIIETSRAALMQPAQ